MKSIFKNIEDTEASVKKSQEVVMYLSEKEMKKIMQKEKNYSKSASKLKKTRDISHLQDKLKKNFSSTPIQLPTNISHLKSIISAPISLRVLSSKKSLNPLHSDSDQAIPSNSMKILNSHSLLSMNSSPELPPLDLLRSPSGLQEVKSLKKWFKLMKNAYAGEEESEIIHTMCGKELVRQVSVHCSLRGKLLKEVLESQPSVYANKWVRVCNEFEKFKENQVDLIEKIHKNYENIEKNQKIKYQDLQDSLEKSEKIRKELEESLEKSKAETKVLRLNSLEGEKIWRKKAIECMNELHRIKGIVYVGTNQLARFFSREKIRELGFSQEVGDYLQEIIQEKTEVSAGIASFEEKDLECLRKFKTLLLFASGISVDEIEILEGIKNFEKVEKLQESRDVGGEKNKENVEEISRDLEERKGEDHLEAYKENEIGEKVEKSEGNNEGAGITEAKKKKDFWENGNPQGKNVKTPEKKSRSTEKILWENIESVKNKLENPKSKEFHTDFELSTQHCHSNPLKPIQRSFTVKVPEASSLPLPEIIKKAPLLIRFPSDSFKSDNEGSQNFDYIKFADESTPHSYADEELSLSEDYIKNDFESALEPRMIYLSTEINEVPSNEEESQNMSSNFLDGTPSTPLPHESKIEFQWKSTQTEEIDYQNYLEKFDNLEGLFEKAATEEAKITISLIQGVLKNIDPNYFENEVRHQSRSFSQIIKHRSDKSINSQDSHLDTSTVMSPSEIKSVLADLVKAFSVISASCEIKKQELIETEEQLEIKKQVLSVIVQHSSTQKPNENSKILELKPIKKTESLPVNKNLDNSAWNEGYEAGYEDGKSQGFLMMVNKVNAVKGQQKNYKQIYDSVSLYKFSTLDSKGFRKKALSKTNTKFAEFNFHTPIRAFEKKKNNPGPAVLERFLAQNMNKVKQRAIISRKNLNKILFSIYNEASQRLANENGTCLIEATYDEFTVKSALKSASEKKFVEFIASVVVNAEYKRCYMYVKLIGYGNLLAIPSYSKYSVEIYLVCFQYLTTSNLGIHFFSDEDDKIMIPTLRVVECVKEKLASNIDKNNVNEILVKIEQKSVADPRKINAGGLIEMESALEIILEYYEVYTLSISNGVNLCLKAMGYADASIIIFIDFLIILRFFGKNPKETGKEIGIDEVLEYCFKNNIGKEEEITKKILTDEGEMFRKKEFYEESIGKITDFIEEIADNEEKLRTHDVNIWQERLDFLESHWEINEIPLVLLGLSLYSAETSRVLSELKLLN